METLRETGEWIICPVCGSPNPRGTKFCQHCWGAAIHADSLVLSSDRLEEWRSHLRRRKFTKPLVIGLVSLVMLAVVVYLFLFYNTDVISGPPAMLTSSSRLGDWAMFRRDISRSGADVSSGVVPQGILKWSFSAGGAIDSSPAVADGAVFFGSKDYRLYAIDAATGDKRWEFQTGSWVESSPSVAGGIVYFGSNDGKFYAVNARTGETVWYFPTRYPVASGAAIAGDIVYFGADDYMVYALDASTGKKVWEYETAGLVKSSPTVTNGLLYVGSSGEYFYALHALNGRVRLRFKSYAPVYSAPVASGESIYLVTSNGGLYSINGTARSWPGEHEIKPLWIQVWAFGLPAPRPPPQSGQNWRLRLGASNSSTPVISGNTLYVGIDNKLIAFDVQKQEKVWEFKTGGLVRSSPALAGKTIYVGSDDGRLYAIDAMTGRKLWEFVTNGPVTSSPAVVDGVVYFGSQDGIFYALE